MDILINGAGTTERSCEKTQFLALHLTHTHTHQYMINYILNVKRKTIKLLNENQKYLQDLGIHNIFLKISPKTGKHWTSLN